MAITHKFYQENFGNGFETVNAVLNVTYKPEIMIIGTYNPCVPTNNADFFYGRNFFWTGIKNLITHNELVILQKRNFTNPLNPTLPEIFELCQSLKLSFADLILQVFPNTNDYELLPRNKVNFNGQNISLINDNGLAQLNQMGQVDWNINNIVRYLNENPSIKRIYFTRKATGIWNQPWNQIVEQANAEDRIFTNIFTPSGQGRPVYHSMSRLLNHWVHNQNPNFGKIDNEWLVAKGVILNNF